MNDQFKQQLETAFREPAVPEKLVESTIRRCQAVTRARLAREGDALSREERRELAADGPAEVILAGLRQGTLLRQIVARGERRVAAPKQPERSKSGPDMKK